MSRRRLAYTLPPPSYPIPQLFLPPSEAQRHGRPHPLIWPIRPPILQYPEHVDTHAPSATGGSGNGTSSIRHRLGVASLALDASFCGFPQNESDFDGLSSDSEGGVEGGVLYSGGRDGMVVSWDLHTPYKPQRRDPDHHSHRHRHRKRSGSSVSSRRWEFITGWDDATTGFDDNDDFEFHNSVGGAGGDGDVLGDVVVGGASRTRHPNSSLGCRDSWIANGVPKQRASYRSHSQAHTDWVNDLLLINGNRHLISASSDATVKLFTIGSTPTYDAHPITLGTHSDYVRTLTSSPFAQDPPSSLSSSTNSSSTSSMPTWIASGAFDRCIKLWDPHVPNKCITHISLPSSIYTIEALASPSQLIASGGPDKVICLSDPKSGRKVGKLVGHGDMVRSIIGSWGGDYLLSASSDTSIKLWSLRSPHRCLHTFSFHTESVWALASTHPRLEVFYSGDRSGNVVRVDCEGIGDLNDGYAVLLGTNRSSETSISMLNGSAHQASAPAPAHPHPQAQAQAQAQRSSAVPPIPTPANNNHHARDADCGITKLVPVDNGWVWAASGRSEVSRWRDMGSRPSGGSGGGGDYGASGASLNGQISIGEGLPRAALIPTTGVDAGMPWSSMVRIDSGADGAFLSGIPLHENHSPHLNHHPGNLGGEDGNIPTQQKEFMEREVIADARPLTSSPLEAIAGRKGLTRAIILSSRLHALSVDTAGEVAVWSLYTGTCLGFFPATASELQGLGARERLEVVRERVEGEAIVQGWCVVDTRVGDLVVVLDGKSGWDAECFGDEIGDGYDDEYRLNIPRWILTNLFRQFIETVRRRHVGRELPERITIPPPSSFPASMKSPPISAQPLTPAVSSTATPKTPGPATSLATIPQSPPLPLSLNIDATPKPRTANPLPVTTPAPAVPPAAVAPGTNAGAGATATGEKDKDKERAPEDYFTQRSRSRSFATAGAATGAAVPTASPATDDFNGWGGPPSAAAGLAGVFMSRLKPWKTRKGTSESSNSAAPDATEEKEETAEPEVQKTFLEQLISGGLSPPASKEAPLVQFPPDTRIVIAEDGDAFFHGTVASIGTDADVNVLETVIPPWLADCLLLNRIPTIPPPKISFLLVPFKGAGYEELPELSNSNSKLTATRFLRSRKVSNYVYEKLSEAAAAATPPNVHSSPPPPVPPGINDNKKADELYEIVCCDIVVPWYMTLGAIKQYIWRHASGEMVLFYRLKHHPPASVHR